MVPEVDFSPLLNHAPSQRLFAAVVDAGGEIRFVGGCVRDVVMGEATGDRDCATNLRPEQVMDVAEKAGFKAIPTGLKHGTVTVVADHVPFEITTLRRDVQSHGRHAEVAFTDSWEEDATRRDFTMNALYVDGQGRLYDFTGGVEDILTRKVRFIGDAAQRIEEDALRILRFYRFSARIGTEHADDMARSAIRGLHGMVERLSGERIYAEMMKLLALQGAERFLRLMGEDGVLPFLLLPSVVPEEALAKVRGVERLALWFRLSGRGAEPLTERWRFPKKEAEFLHHAIAYDVQKLMAGDEWAVKAEIRAFGGEFIAAMVRIAQAQTGWNGQEVLALVETFSSPQFPIKGADVLALGFPAGPHVGKVLKEAEAHWEASHYTPSRTELLDWVRQRLTNR